MRRTVFLLSDFENRRMLRCIFFYMVFKTHLTILILILVVLRAIKALTLRNFEILLRKLSSQLLFRRKTLLTVLKIRLCSIHLRSLPLRTTPLLLMRQLIYKFLSINSRLLPLILLLIIIIIFLGGINMVFGS